MRTFQNTKKIVLLWIQKVKVINDLIIDLWLDFLTSFFQEGFLIKIDELVDLVLNMNLKKMKITGENKSDSLSDKDEMRNRIKKMIKNKKAFNYLNLTANKAEKKDGFTGFDIHIDTWIHVLWLMEITCYGYFFIDWIKINWGI